jgi:hypothetical protein
MGRGGDHKRRYRINQLVYYESYPSITDAIQRETSIKRWPRAWKTNLILGMNPTWRDLYEELNTRLVHPLRHHWPCACDPDPKSAVPHMIGMAGTGPAMS